MVDDNPLAPRGADPHAAAPDRLNSWKEIATYLGKGVRTVQRWETQMGLPVRRLGREGGEIVYALKSEIDAWILNGGHAAATDQPQDIPDTPLEAAPEAQDEEASPPAAAAMKSGPSTQAPGHVASPSWLWAILALLGLLGLAMTLAQRDGGGRAGAARNPVGAAFEGGFLHAWDLDGKPLWRIGLEASPDNRLDTRLNQDFLGLRRIAVEDVDGDGVNEVLLIAVSASGSGDSLRVFNADGSARFSHVPGRPVTFGSETYRGFNANGLYVLRDAGGAPGLWVTAAHVSFFPSLLQRLSPRGEVLSEYWSNGHIRTIRPAVVKGRPFLLVGGYNNERHGGSLAFLDLSHPSGTAPAENVRYRCRDCAEGEPSEFLVFPASDVLREFAAGGGSAVVSDARLTGDGEVVVTVHQAGAKIPGEADAVDGSLNYTLFSEDLRLKRLEVLWGYLKLHRAFEAVGRLKHAFGPEEEKQLSAVFRWDHGKFVALGGSTGSPALASARKPPASRGGS